MVPDFPFTRANAHWVFMGLLSSTLIYTSELILCSTICVPSATRHNIHMSLYFLFAAIYHLKLSPTFSVRPCSSSNLDHVYFVHPSTDISVDTSTDSRPMYRSPYRSSIGRYADRYIGRESVDMSAEMRRSTYRPTYRSSIGRYVDRHSTDMLADMSKESGCPIVGRHVDR